MACFRAPCGRRADRLVDLVDRSPEVAAKAMAPEAFGCWDSQPSGVLASAVEPEQLAQLISQAINAVNRADRRHFEDRNSP